MKIGVKLVVTIGVFNIIGIGVLSAITIALSQKEISRLSEELARSQAGENNERIRNWFGVYVETARSLAYIMEGYKEIPVEDRRRQFNLILKQALVAHPEVSAIYTSWAPNALDGMDAEHADTPGTDASGRYMTSWTYKPTGPIMEAIQSFGFDEIMRVTSGGEFIVEPSTLSIGGKDTLATTICIPIKDQYRMIGVVGIIVELSRIQTIVSWIQTFGDGRMAFSPGGLVTAHNDPSRLGKNMLETEADTFGPFLDTMIDAVSTGTAVSFSYRPLESNTVYQYYSTPFVIGESFKPWTLVIKISRDTVMAPVYRMLFICALIGVLAIVFISLGVLFIARSISHPINNLAVALKDISQGEGDLTKTIRIIARNEVGHLAYYFNLTIEKINNLVLSIRRKAVTLNETGSRLAGNMLETAASISNITASLQSVKSRTTDHEASIRSVGATMEELVGDIGTLDAHIQRQAECVSQSSSSVEEMLANIQGVAQMLVSNSGSVDSLAQASETGRSGLQEVSGDIKEIARESEGLLEINAVMQNIASQTNLLSMNAAIEAAHAGEAGKGFAVVADEIRKLAESSSKQSKMVSGVLKRIKDSIGKIAKSTEGVLLKFEAIREGVREVSEQEGNVRAAMEEQDAGSKSILESISRLNEITKEVRRGVRTMSGRSGEVIKESKGLERITGEIGEGIREMAAGSEQISKAVNRANDISEENKEQIEALMGEVSRFKVHENGGYLK
jgi:methyl-accepting chemotaxis protein